MIVINSAGCINLKTDNLQVKNNKNKILNGFKNEVTRNDEQKLIGKIEEKILNTDIPKNELKKIPYISNLSNGEDSNLDQNSLKSLNNNTFKNIPSTPVKYFSDFNEAGSKKNDNQNSSYIKEKKDVSQNTRKLVYQKKSSGVFGIFTGSAILITTIIIAIVTCKGYTLTFTMIGLNLLLILSLFFAYMFFVMINLKDS